MQTTPASWGSIFTASHKTEYRFVINGVSYQGSDLKDTPVIKKPLLDKPAIGRCCTASAQVKIYPKGDIPKAATVDAYCRLRSEDGKTVTDWLPQGKYYISTRSGKSPLQLNCLDRMIKAGVTYRDKSAFTTWPRPMTAVVNEICKIMGVTLDSRTEIKTGGSYTVDYPNDDTLISEVLGWIAAAHGGNWIITETGKLRLVVLTSPAGDAVQLLGKAHTGFTARGKLQTISRVILKDDADNEFTAGDDTGLTISAQCNYATQAIASTLCSAGGIPIENGCATIPGASYANGLLRIPSGSVSQGKVDLVTASTLYGVTYEPYTLSGAYLNPAIELGDTISVTDRSGTVHKVVVFSITINCTISGTCALSATIDGETEDEYPYITMQQLTLSRTLKTNQSYFGNRINRAEGFVSELLVNDVVEARLTANASIFSMQSRENGAWKDRIYFDSATGKYVITGDVTVQGIATFEESLASSGATVINGGNITTGVIQSHDGKLKFDLDSGIFTVNNKDLETALRAVDNTIHIMASGQMFTKAASATAYTPTSITLTAQSTNTLASYQWYKNNTAISGATARTLTVKPSDISGTSATYKVVGTDSDGNTHTDYLTIAKLADGSNGQPGTPGAQGAAGEDSYTAILSNEYIEVPVDVNRKPVAAATYSCTVQVYKGLTALTATKNTPAAGQFKVTPGTATGVTVAQSTAGTITLTVAKSTAIADSAELALTIAVYGGFTIKTKITIHANMNNVTVQQQATIEANSEAITLKVSKGEIASSINQTAQSVLIDASKIDLQGFVTVNSLKNGTTTINGGCITTGTIDASQVSVINLNASNIKSGTLSADYLKGGTIDASLITVKNLSASAITSGTFSADRISGGTIDANKVTITNLNASNIKSGKLSADMISGGTLDAQYITVKNLNASAITSGTFSADRISGGTIDASKVTINKLNASNITSGTLDASKVTVSNLDAGSIKSGTLSASYLKGGTLDASLMTVKNLSASAITSGTLDASKITVKNLDVSNAHIQQVYAYSSSYQIVMKASGTTTLYLGGDGTWNVSYVYLYASSKVQIGGYSAFTNGLTIDTSSRVLRSNSSGTYSAWSLGNSSYPFANLYVDTARLGKSGGSIGFFGTTPVTKKSVSKCSTLSTVTASTVATALNNLLTALAGYGLITSS